MPFFHRSRKTYLALFLILVSTIPLFFLGKYVVNAAGAQHYLYVIPDGSLYVYDMDNGFNEVKHVTLPTVTDARGVAVDPATASLFIPYYDKTGGATSPGWLLKYNLNTDTIVWNKRLTFSVDSPALSPDGTKLYMPESQASYSGLWHIINASDGSSAGTIPTTSGYASHNTVVSVVVSGSISSFNNANLGAALRWKDTNNWYKAYINGTNLIIQSKVNGTATTLKSVAFTAATGTAYSIHFRVVGTTLSANVWKAGATEPSGWMATASDTSLTSGQAGLRVQLVSGVTAKITSFTADTPASGTTPTPGVTPTVAPTGTVTGTPTSTSTPTSGSAVGQDTFQRANQSLWGTASDGQSWSGDANTANIFSINGNAGQIANGSTSYNAVLGPMATNEDVVVSGSVSSFSNSTNLGAVLRWTDTTNWYKAYIDGSNLVIQSRVNGTATTLKSVAFAATANTSYTIHFRVVGTALTANVWKTGTSEPILDAWIHHTKRDDVKRQKTSTTRGPDVTYCHL